MRVVWSPQASRDLLDIWLYISRDSVLSADRFITELAGKCDDLATFPLAGRLRPELIEGARSISYKQYVAFYRVTGETIEIIRVIHGARDLARALGE